MIRADLHLHSTASDGILTPRGLAGAALAAGLSLIAITDHDTFDGTDSVQGDAGIEIIPAVELSMADMHGLHILCYGLAKGEELRRRTADLAEKRRLRARLICEKLAGLGMPVEDALTGCSGTIGRLHIARAMAAKGYVQTPAEALARWISRDGPAYVASERMRVAEALPLIRRNGFLPVLAHPYELDVEPQTLIQLVDRWTDLGLAGIEVYHPSALGRDTGMLERLARSRGLLVTAGSDFHESRDFKHGEIGSMIPLWHRAEEDIAALRAELEKNRKAPDGADR